MTPPGPPWGPSGTDGDGRPPAQLLHPASHPCSSQLPSATFLSLSECSHSRLPTPRAMLFRIRSQMNQGKFSCIRPQLRQ